MDSFTQVAVRKSPRRICHRKMEGAWNNDQPYYRCRFGDEYALVNKIRHPRNVYLREAILLPTLDRWLGRYFARHRRADTIKVITAAQGGVDEDAATIVARQTITECDRKLARYRATLDALEADADPAVIAGWITQAQQQRAAAEAELRQLPRQTRMTEDDIAALIDEIADHALVLADADPTHKADLYGKIGLQLTYQPGKQKFGPRLTSTRLHMGKWCASEVEHGPSAYIDLLLGKVPLNTAALVDRPED